MTELLGLFFVSSFTGYFLRSTMLGLLIKLQTDDTSVTSLQSYSVEDMYLFLQISFDPFFDAYFEEVVPVAVVISFNFLFDNISCNFLPVYSLFNLNNSLGIKSCNVLPVCNLFYINDSFNSCLAFLILSSGIVV